MWLPSGRVAPPLQSSECICPTRSKLRQEGRGQQPFNNGRKDRILEIMREAAPSGCKVPSTTRFGLFNKIMSTVSMFGTLPHATLTGAIERQGMATLRYHIKGSRQIVLMNYSDVATFLESKGM